MSESEHDIPNESTPASSEPPAAEGAPEVGAAPEAASTDEPQPSDAMSLPARAGASSLATAERATPRSAMLTRPRGAFRLLRRLFNRVNVSDDCAARMTALGEGEHRVVYVMRTRSELDYLLFNHLYLTHGAPLARFANGVSTLFHRNLRGWVRDRVRRVLRRPESPPPVEQLTAEVEAGGAALLFLKSLSLTTERPTDPRFIEALVALQRRTDQPILLVPQHIAWPPKPPSKRRKLIDIAFGDMEASGRLRKLVYVARFSGKSAVRIGEPIDLSAVIADHPGWSDARVARKVRRVLFIHLGHERMALTGPAVKPGAVLIDEIMQRRRFRRQIAETAAEIGEDPERAIAEVRSHLDEIGARLNFEVTLLAGRMLDLVFGRIFEGIEVDEAGLQRVRDAARHSRRAPLILMPCHKSHLDYMVVSWAMIRAGFTPPHVAAGANLAFWPVGSLFRRSGAFFLRRSFAGQPLYTLAFRQYLWKLVREGYPIEFYVEGTRSRTGKLLPPRLGMMNMLLEGVRQGQFKDLQFVPIHLSYEKVIETGAYRRELTGGAKEAESVAGVVKAGKVLRSRYGRIYVNFEAPVRLSSWLEGQDVELTTIGDEGLRETTRQLSYHLMRRIHDASVVTPSGLIGAVLLSHHRRGISGARLLELVGFLVGLLERRGVRMSRSIDSVLERQANRINAAASRTARAGARARGEALRPLTREALKLLRKLVDARAQAGDTVYVVPDKSRIELDYYRNGILAMLAPDCIIATALLSTERAVPRARLMAACSQLSQWLRFEFIYPVGQGFEAVFDQTLTRLADEGLVAVLDDGTCLPAAPLTLDFLRGMMLHLVEGYWIAADAVRTLTVAPMDGPDWLEYAREHGEMEFLQGDVRRAEAASTAVLRNALRLYVAEGLISKTEKPTRGRGKPIARYGVARGVTLESIALRRDDIGVYLLGAHDEPLRQIATDENPSAVEPIDEGPLLPEYAEEPFDEGQPFDEVKAPEEGQPLDEVEPLGEGQPPDEVEPLGEGQPLEASEPDDRPA